MRLTSLLVALCLALGLAGPLRAQDTRLADIRAELDQLGAELQGLRDELVAGASASQPLSGSTLQRLDALEAEITRLTAKTEDLELRINKIVQDGTNRIGDLQFRLTELEGGDPAGLGPTPPLGGDTPAATAPAAGGAELAMGEQADFDRAKAALDAGDFQGALDQLDTFAQTYPGSPLEGEARFYKGEALRGLGQTASAARAYLDSFSGAPNGPRAADSLLQLGLSLDRLGQHQEACVTLAEVSNRYPDSAAAQAAATERASLNCP
jgi:tol-pal system protein YbgF